ncbi:MAG TPA: phage holin family protein [Caulobacteraceae bacterium]|nr:phage holin family protein [Caulobacteraceae bacterium]
MTRFLLRALVAAIGLWVASYIVPGVHVHGLGTLIVAGLALGLVNALVRPIVTILTLPITIVTLGLFLLVVNGAMVLLVGWILHRFGVHGYVIHGLVPAILATVVIWLVSLAANVVIGGDERRKRR